MFAGGITGNNTARMRTPRECHRCFKAPQEVQHLPTPSNPFRVPAPPPPATGGIPQFPNAQAQQHMQSIYREMGFPFGNQA